MNGRLAAVLAFALAVAAVASFSVYHFIASGMERPGTAGRVSKILVANQDLAVGAMLRESDVRQADWTGDLPVNALTTVAQAAGRGVITQIYKDETVLEPRLANKGAGAGLAAIIPPGKRAVALRVNDVVGLAGFIQPGMRVDVLISGNAPGSSLERSGVLVRTVLQNIEVLSAGQRIEKNPESKPEDAQVVNLLVSPDQAEILSLAGTETKVQLVLRNPLDTLEEPTRGTSIAHLFGAPEGQPALPRRTTPAVHAPVRPVARPATPVASAAEFGTVEVFSGAKRSEQRFTAETENR